jgi:DNA-binding CsgD family transcriptional regulator
MEAFALTRAETALTLALLHGETVDEYCERTGISRNTARTHMRAIFDKLGIKRQTELIRLLSGFRMLNMGERG